MEEASTSPLPEPTRGEPTFIIRQEMEEAERRPIAGGTAAVFSTRSPEKDSVSEDAAVLIIVDDDTGVFAVADGMGGQPGGAMAASLAVQSINESVQTARTANGTVPSLRDAILTGFEEANRAVTNIGVGAATTLAVVEVQGDVARPYHVGDSFIMLVGQRGRVKLQTISHSPVGYAVESGLLAEREAMHHEDRHLVSNMVGSPEMRIDIGSAVKLQARDTLILASDGLSDNLHTEEIVAMARKGPLKRVAADLAALCRRRMSEHEEGQPCKPDDLTFIVWRRGAK